MCSEHIIVDEYSSIDECLYSMGNEVAFKCYNPNKPNPYGINIKCLNSVKYPYTHRSEVFAGKPANIEDAQ